MLLQEEREKAGALKTYCFAIQMQSVDRIANSFHVLKKESSYINVMHFSLDCTMGKIYLHDHFKLQHNKHRCYTEYIVFSLPALPKVPNIMDAMTCISLHG